MKENKFLIFIVFIAVFLFGIYLGLNFNKLRSGINPIYPNLFSRSCQYNGKTYKSGQTMPSIDGCNTCGCEKGQIVCTTMACETVVNPTESSPSLISCQYNGKTYQSGQTMPSIDGCNTCSCEEGRIACTTIACNK